MKLKIFSSTTPESEFDDWYSETHGGTNPSWEIEEDCDEVDYDIMEDEDE